MDTVSIITPIYHGKKYICQLKEMIEVCAREASNLVHVEWIISNDSPDDNITCVNCSENMDVTILTTDRNRGIHGARVRGLEVATGDYIAFWDQDDIFPESWIRSQVLEIGDAALVVCNQLRNGQEYYGRKGEPSLDESISRDFLLNNKNGFLPGQALIRADSIPQIWKNKILKKNCADDYYLWLAMLANGCDFVSNNDTYCNHIMHGKNESLDLGDAYDSLNEMMDIISGEKLFNEEDMKSLIASRERTLKRQLREIQIVKNKMQILKEILGRYESKQLLSNDLLKENSGYIAIYGADLGVHIANKLCAEGVNIKCIVDRNAQWISLSVPTVTIDDIPGDIKIIVMTLLEQGKTVKEELNKKYPSIQVIHINNLL